MILIRFLINFILFGALFYLIWHFFPDAFTTLVSWIKIIIDYAQQFFTDLFNRISASTSKKEVEPAKTLLGIVFTFLK